MSETLTPAPAAGNEPPRPTTDLPAQFVPASVEGPLYEQWVERGYFEGLPKSGKTPYAVVIPPPNVTGSLHLGHAFEHTLIDALVRRRRMQGYDAVWIPGMDHAGIATQNVVEKQLRERGQTRHDLGRDAFVAKVWEWKAESGGAILSQMRRLGDGVDWSREAFTMDEERSRGVRTIFKKLYDDKLIYRAERIINWCPRCLTALSDIEVEHQDDEGELVELIYGGGPDGTGEDRIVVATTRVETMLGDTAIAVHPKDPRYTHLVGRQIDLPLTGRMIPVVADEHVDPEFGTGAVKVTPAHDPNDFEIGRRHNLPSITIMTPEATITGTGTRFDGMDRFEARVAVREALAEQGRIGAQKRPYLHSVGHCSRSHDVIEPRLSLQWFVDVAPLAKASGDAVRSGAVTIHPAEMEPRWFAWVDNMHDWCISRQLWWGHRIPVWYSADGEVRCVGPDEEPPGEGWTQDPDVLDTWFSSGLWPFSTLGWPDQTEDLARYYPNAVVVTGYDILFFWVARMMMMGIYANDGTPPFPAIVLHGMVRDQNGKKMSKSFGNVVDPMVWLDRYGADALRFTLARGANPGTDVPIGEDWVQAGRNFCTKLWNATRFALLNGATADGPLPAGAEQSAVDRWILSRLATVVKQVDAGFEDYQFAKTTETLYHFVWDEVCDWYLELAKLPLAEGGSQAAVTRRVLGEVFDVVLRLLHPIAPFVTEALWTALTGAGSAAGAAVGSTGVGSVAAGSTGVGSGVSTFPESLVIAAWPADDPNRALLSADPAAEAEVLALQRLVTEIRRFRAEQGVKPSLRVAARLGGLDQAGLADQESTIRVLARLDDAGPGFAPSVTVAVGDSTVELDLSGAIDVEAERKRLMKDLAAAVKERDQTSAKLGNEQFVGKAPESVVAKIRGRQAGAEADISRLEAQLAELPVG